MKRLRPLIVGLSSLFLYPPAFAAPPAARAAPPKAGGAEQRPVTQEQFRQAILVLKRTVERVDHVEQKQATGGGGGGDEIDLSKMGTSSTGGGTAVPAKGLHGPTVAEPNFKVYFDF